MGKISPVSAKYIVQTSIDIEGVVDKPDVIGAIFGQTEGLLGSELELRELQRSGRIGRIEVNTETKAGKTSGMIVVPSSMDKAETAIIGASLEIIQRIGPCNATIKVQKIEDVRISKRKQVVDRAKDLLRNLMDTSMPDSQELADEVAYSVRVMEIKNYGRERLPAGPGVEESDEIIVVEGRADVLNLLKYGIKNAIAINGTSVPQTLAELSRQKIVTAFVDGDRGGNLIIKELTAVADIDFVTRAPDGKEVEEITKKEIHMALRGKISTEQAKMELVTSDGERASRSTQRSFQKDERKPMPARTTTRPAPIRAATPTIAPVRAPAKAPTKSVLKAEAKLKFKKMLEDLIGTRGAYLVDNKMTILGKIPLTELESTLKSIGNVYAVVFDGVIDANIVKVLETSNVKWVFGMDSKVAQANAKVGMHIVAEL
jgi:5S rRNA maturation endonuclease (ribonuclease M5)